MIHPSKFIIGEKSQRLKGKTILLGVTSSAAIYRSLDLTRELMRHGAEVHVIMSPEATKLISPELFAWASSNRVLTELSGEIEHIQLTQNPDNKVLIIAPATANTITKISLGIADNALLTTALAAIGNRIPTIIVPAMHLSLWNNPNVQKAIRNLEELGITIIKPNIVKRKAKYPRIEDIVEHVFRITSPKNLIGKKVLVTAGSTRVYIDSIRFISNPSSGKMGVAMALEAWIRGADVTLLLAKHADHGYTIPQDIRVRYFETYDDIRDILIEEIAHHDIFIHAAAVSDYAPEKRPDKKIPSGKLLTLHLKPTEKLLDLARKANENAYVVAFKAEWKKTDEELIQKAQTYIEKETADAVVANDVSRGIFGSDETEVVLVYRKNSTIFTKKLIGNKRIVGSEILATLFE